jgi:hypothetical protein
MIIVIILLKQWLNRCFGEVKKGESPTKHLAKLYPSSWHYEQTQRSPNTKVTFLEKYHDEVVAKTAKVTKNLPWY